MPLFLHRNVFNAGEFSPLLDGRTDLPNFGFGCRVMKNFLPRTHGGAFRRPGTEFLGALSGPCRLMEFNVTASMQYVLEFTDLKLRIWEDGVLVEDASNDPVELTTIYPIEDLFDVQMKQINNVAYFTHPNHPPQKLSRYADSDDDASWTWETVDLQYPPMREENASTNSVTASDVTGPADITLTFDQWIFLDTNNRNDYIGSYIEVTHRRDKASESLALTENPEASPGDPDENTTEGEPITIVGDYTVTTYGTWSGTLSIESEDTNGDWHVVRVFEGTKDEPRNISYKATAETVRKYRLKFEHTTHSGNPTAVLEVEDTRYSGLVKITSVNVNRRECTAEVITPLYSTDATPYFRLGAWGNATGYPRAVSFHEQRLVFGGTRIQPNTVWMSGTNDFENFRYGAYDSDPLAFTLAADEASPIQSILSHVALLIFTQTEEWALLTSEQTPITPANLFVRRQSRIGTTQRPALLALDAILLLERGARKVRRFGYGNEGGVSEELTVLAEHLTRSGIRQMAFQQQPDPILWCVTEDGALIAMTIDPSQNVSGWSRHETEGSFESVAIVYGDSGLADEVYFVVKRTIEEVDQYYLERLDPLWLQKLEDDNQETLVYSDSAVVYELGSPQAVFTGLDHLEGETVAILANGEYRGTAEVDSGQITLPASNYTGVATECENVVIGLPYESVLQPTKFELETPGGTAQGRTFQTERVTLNVWKTLGIEVADGPDEEFYEAAYHDPELSLGTPTPPPSLFTGLVEEQIDGAHRENIDVTVRQTQPFPAAILSIIPKFETHGN